MRGEENWRQKKILMLITMISILCQTTILAAIVYLSAGVPFGYWGGIGFAPMLGVFPAYFWATWVLNEEE